ncbi:MAG TPA: DUF4962 domain-containing protein [Tepidisphaeraceae bacterium]|nr:DUF4962 domain-containing protein [Tepidisphaeraceae bacterium]
MRYLIFLLSIFLVACESPKRDRAETEPREYRPQVYREEPEAPQVATSTHPRLIVSDHDLAETKRLIQEHPTAKQWFALVHERCEALMNKPPVQQQADMLHVSREALVRITNLAGAYRLTGDKRYADRAIVEMLAVCRFGDWQPSNFLATAEMTFGMGVGYDWVYDVLTPEQRELIHQTIDVKGLRAGIEAYDSRAGWTEARHNWNLVCNGGLIVGALAVMDEEPHDAKEVLKDARSSIRYGMSVYEPDGAWEEGPTYWNYATRYAVFGMSALQSALGTDWGLQKSPGFANTGMFRIYTTGPTGLPFNFADSESIIGNSAQMYWLARAVDRPVYAAFEHQIGAQEPGLFDLMFYRPTDNNLVPQLPRDAMFRGLSLGSFRGSWTDPLTTYIAFKGGSNDAHHGHLDLGTFVLDALGERWGVALGADDYDLPAYFGSRRWTYYRCSTRGQNTIMIDNRNQEIDGKATIINFRSGDNRSQAILNMSDAYRYDARRVMRGIALLNNRQVLVQDEIDLPRVADVAWSFHTTAQIEVLGSVAHLRQNGKELTARILSPGNAQFEVLSANPPPPQQQMPNLKKLVIRLHDAHGRVAIGVIFSPGEKDEGAPEIVPLERWLGR